MWKLVLKWPWMEAVCSLSPWWLLSLRGLSGSSVYFLGTRAYIPDGDFWSAHFWAHVFTSLMVTSDMHTPEYTCLHPHGDFWYAHSHIFLLFNYVNLFPITRNSSLFLNPANIFFMMCWFFSLDKSLIGQGFQKYGLFAFVDVFLTVLGVSVGFISPCARSRMWTSHFQDGISRTTQPWLLRSICSLTPVMLSWTFMRGEDFYVLGLKDFRFLTPTLPPTENQYCCQWIEANMSPQASKCPLGQVCHAQLSQLF